MSKQTKGWAVVTKRGRVIATNLVRHRAIDEACDYHRHGWANDLWRDMRAAGYRCIRVTITPEQKEPK